MWAAERAICFPRPPGRLPVQQTLHLLLKTFFQNYTSFSNTLTKQSVNQPTSNDVSRQNMFNLDGIASNRLADLYQCCTAIVSNRCPASNNILYWGVAWNPTLPRWIHIFCVSSLWAASMDWNVGFQCRMVLQGKWKGTTGCRMWTCFWSPLAFTLLLVCLSLWT